VCVVSTPKISAPPASQSDKPPPIIRNPILDGMLGNIAAIRGGTSAFRINLVNPLTIPTGGGLGGGGASGGAGAGGGGSSSGSSGSDFTSGDRTRLTKTGAPI